MVCTFYIYIFVNSPSSYGIKSSLLEAGVWIKSIKIIRSAWPSSTDLWLLVSRKETSDVRTHMENSFRTFQAYVCAFQALLLTKEMMCLLSYREYTLTLQRVSVRTCDWRAMHVVIHKTKTRRYVSSDELCGLDWGCCCARGKITTACKQNKRHIITLFLVYKVKQMYSTLQVHLLLKGSVLKGYIFSRCCCLRISERGPTNLPCTPSSKYARIKYT